jgi:hypothetical protein
MANFRFKAGKNFPATFNRLVDQLENGGPDVPDAFAKQKNTGVILVRNATEAEVPRFGVLGLDVPSILPSNNLPEFQNRVIMDGVSPVYATHRGKFAVLAQPLGVGEVGKAYVSGVFMAYINVTDAAHEYADVKASQTDKLESYSRGAARILWKESGTGTKWAVVQVGAGIGETISGKVTSDASGNGKYNGKSFTDVTSDVSASGNLAESDFGTLSSTEDCLILNPVELGSSTTGHDVTATANTDKFAIYFTGRLARVNSDGKKVVHAMLFYVGCAEGD